MPASAEKTGILLAAFGSASPLGERTLKVFTEKVRLAFPEVPVRWAFTSDHMRTRLAAARKKTDSVKKALCRMGFERYTHVAVQSLHLIPGTEYECLLEETELARMQGGPQHIEVGLPLLHEPNDVVLATRALLAHLPAERTADEAVVCMGHGTWHSGAASYEALAAAVGEKDPRIFIGTLDGEHTIGSLLPSLAESGVKTVWLLPLLSVIGKHAEQDMAGTHPDSWRSHIEAAGFACKPVLKGTAEYAGFVEIWLAHLGKAMDCLTQQRAQQRAQQQTQQKGTAKGPATGQYPVAEPLQTSSEKADAHRQNPAGKNQA